jgi:hypothetical protein
MHFLLTHDIEKVNSTIHFINKRPGLFIERNEILHERKSAIRKQYMILSN